MLSHVFGRVLVRETDAPVAGAAITLFATTDARTRGADGERLGTTVTDNRGSFRLAYGDDAASALRARSLDLLLTVGLDGASAARAPRSTKVIASVHRSGVAMTEHYLIRVAEADVLRAGLALRGSGEEVTRSIARGRAGETNRERLEEESDRRLAERLSAQVRTDRRTEDDLDRFLSALSAVDGKAFRNGFIPRGASVAEANLAAMRRDIEGTVNRASFRGKAVLTAEQADKFRDASGGFASKIPFADIVPLLRPKGNTLAPVLLRPNSLAGLCVPPNTTDPCLALLEENGAAESDGPPGDEVPAEESEQALTPEDLPILMNRLAQGIARLDGDLAASVAARAGPDDVATALNALTLRSGPADVPAVHEFHHLHIAFSHVWQELFSYKMIEIAKELVSKLTALGIDPDAALEPVGGGPVKHKLKFKPGAFKAASSFPPISVVMVFEITAQEWEEVERLGYAAELENLANTHIAGPDVVKFELDASSLSAIQDALRRYREALAAAKEEHAAAKRKGDNIIRYARQTAFARPRFQNFHKILEALEKETAEPYRFTIFGANARERAVNFGLVATYRQTWDPVSYQVGELVKSIPLAPKEVRRFSKKMTVRRKRSETEVESNLRAEQREQSETARFEAEIIAKARNKTNFQMSAEGGVNVGIVSASASNAFSRDAERSSQETKREFREAVFKAAQEFRAERKLEVTLSEEEEAVGEDSGEISNPNDEITVTYLFYELQRRYRLSERLHQVQPVVLVAQEVPEPAEIDDDWLIAHDWILRRVILDDAFLPALDYLATRVVGDEVALQELFQNVEQQRRLTDELKEEIAELREEEDRRYASLQRTIRRRAEAVQDEQESGFLEDIDEFFSGADSPTPEKMQIIEDAARDAYERAVKQEKNLRSRLAREITALNSLTETYTEKLSDHLNRRAQIARLRVHVKENILHYMQAAWSHEPPDQRFMRLKDVRVPTLSGDLTYSLEPDPDAVPLPPEWKKPLKLEAHCTLDDPDATEPLSKVADLDSMLGFKGNYMMFPLLESNVLTNFMMTPFLDPVEGVRDPDPLDAWSLQDFSAYVCCLKETLSEDAFDDLRPGLVEAYRHILNAGTGGDDEIIVPTDSLFIEALPGAHPVLEDYKLYHRAIDVRKAAAEVREAEFENLRAAARLLAGEREDPDIERKIVVEGAETAIVPSDGE